MVDAQTKQHAVVAEVKADPGSEPLTGWLGLAVDEARNLVYAARNYLSGTPHVQAVSVIDGATNKLIQNITHPTLFQPIAVALDATEPGCSPPRWAATTVPARPSGRE